MDLFSKEEVWKIAKNAVGKGEFELVGHEVGRKSEETLGYLGKHLTLTLELSSEKGRWRKGLFVKTYDVKVDGDDFLGESGIFKREQDFYRIVVEDMKELAGQPDWCPKYFYSKERVLVLEDLSEQGFKMVEGRKGRWALDEAHLEKALETLVSMHVSSILLEREENKTLPAMYPTVLRRELLYDENKLEAPTRKWIQWQIQDLLEGVNYLDKYSSAEKLSISGKFEKQIMRIYPLSKKSDRYRNVLTHGDLWKNNLLFCYSVKNVPTKCKFVDFQFIRYAPPAHDVMHLLHYATDKATRDRTEARFLARYYENLKRRLDGVGVNIEEEIGEEEFVESCKEYKELALIQCLLSTHYLLGPVTLSIETATHEQYEDYLKKHRKKYMKTFFDEESYCLTIKDIFYELIDRYILNT